MPIDQILAFVNAVAAVNGVLLALLLCLRTEAGAPRARFVLSGFLFLVSALLGLFVLLDRGYVLINPALAVLLDAAAIGMSGLMLDYVMTLTGVRRRRWLAYLPAAAYLAAALIQRGPVGAPTDFGPIVVFQIAMTGLAFALYLQRRGRRPGGRARAGLQRLGVFFAVLAVMHAAQLARLILPFSTVLYDAVPLIGALALTGFVILALADSRALGAWVHAPAAPSPDAAFDRKLETAMVRERRFADSSMDLETAAQALEIEPRALSEYLNRRRGQTFREYLREARVAEAKRLLSSPDEARTSMEAIGLLCGFQSRSAFYEAFKAETGSTPAAWRTDLSGNASPDS